MLGGQANVTSSPGKGTHIEVSFPGHAGRAMIRILVADDHTIMREGLKQLLANEADLIVVAEAADGDEVLKLVRELDFHVLLLDMSMPGRSGIELIKQVKTEKPRLRLLVLSMHQESQYAVRAIKAGASGYLTKDSASTQLVSAIRKVAAGGAFITAEVAEQLAFGAMPNVTGLPHTTLSDREYEVFQLLAWEYRFPTSPIGSTCRSRP